MSVCELTKSASSVKDVDGKFCAVYGYGATGVGTAASIFLLINFEQAGRIYQ